MLKRWLYLGLAALTLGLAGGLQAHADSDYDEALSTAPQGISLNKANSIIAIGTAPLDTASVVDVTNPNSVGTQAVVVNTAPYQFGAAWSTDDNLMDLSHDQTIGFWFYFGDQGSNAGDGMAFVLQNDPNGIAATPTFGSKVVGETLGVWGVDTNASQDYVSSFAKTAIQNSWALEFDTHFNGTTGSGAPGNANAFDVGYPAVHIASNYPGSGDTYKKMTYDAGLLSKAKYYYEMNHLGVISDSTQTNFLSNGLWHHMTLKWDASAKTMTYTFDDRNPTTGIEETGQSETVPIDLSKIDPDNTGYARWGFTGTTGEDYENNLIVMDNTPGLVDGTADASMTDLTHNKPITTDSQIIGNDQVELDYNLTYNGGRQSWSSIDGRLKLPNYINYTSGEITYENGDTEDLSPDKISDAKLDAELGQSLDSDNSTAKLKLLGTADNVTETQYNLPQASTFSSNALVATADTPSFAINPSVTLDLALTSPNDVTLHDKEDTTITGNVTVNTAAATKPTTTLATSLNGAALPDTPVNSDGSFSLDIAADQLQMGTNTVDLTAQTANGDTSKTITVTITVVGTLQFVNVAAHSSFADSSLTGSPELVQRSSDWNLTVQDTRGTGQSWVLDAQTTPFVDDDDQPMDGGPVYVGRYGTQQLNSQPTQVMIHTTDDSVDDGLTDVSGTWTGDTGLLLNVGSGTAAGTYHGTITWTLTNAPS